MVPWEASTDEIIINEARWEIARCVAWRLGEEPPQKEKSQAILDYLQARAPPLHDPFSGAGSIPLEAQRLGLPVYGSDLNPLAVLIGKGLVEIPPRFSGMPPVNPDDRAEIERGAKWNGKWAQGLADDILYYAGQLRDEAQKRIGYLYPTTQLPDGSEASVVAWLWARTVRSPDPSAKGALVPLVSSFMLSTKEGKKAWVQIELDPSAQDGWRFHVKEGSLEKSVEKQLTEGTKAARATFRCVLTGANISGTYIDSEARAGRVTSRLMAIVADGARSRAYLSPTATHEAQSIFAEEKLSEFGDIMDLPKQICRGTFASNAQGRRYLFDTFSDYYTARQLIAITTFSDIVKDIIPIVERDAARAGVIDSSIGIADNGQGTRAYAESIATYLSLSIGRMALYGSSLCRWLTKDNALGSAIAQKGIEMTWDFAEANFFAKSSASVLVCARNVADCLLQQIYSTGVKADISMLDARERQSNEIAVWNTDPPYYSNIAYADLSDYFYVWHRRTLKEIYPNLFRRLTTNKNDELIATSYRERNPGGYESKIWDLLKPSEKAEAFFIAEMYKVFCNIYIRSSDDYPSIVYYAFRQQNESEEGLTSAGWAAVLQALCDAGFSVDGTWPLRTELTAALKANVNALASSIVLVCRRRDLNALAVTRAEFVRALKSEMPKAIEAIQRAGVGPVDMQQSIIGPGMGIFTRYATVLESDDSPMGVKTALTLINRVWEEIENELDANFDPETQVALAWYASYGFEAKKSGELNVVANAKNVPDKALFESRVFDNLHGNAALTKRADLPLDWSPATEKHLTVWRCVQQVARTLQAKEGGGDAAAKLVAQMGRHAADAQKLAYRLFEIATRRGLNDEALVYNELAQEWARLEDLAASAAPSAPGAEAQATFQF